MQDRWKDGLENGESEESFSLDDIIKEVREMSKRDGQTERPIEKPLVSSSSSSEEKIDVAPVIPKEERPLQQDEKILQSTPVPTVPSPQPVEATAEIKRQETKSVDYAPTQKVGPSPKKKEKRPSDQEKTRVVEPTEDERWEQAVKRQREKIAAQKEPPKPKQEPPLPKEPDDIEDFTQYDQAYAVGKELKYQTVTLRVRFVILLVCLLGLIGLSLLPLITPFLGGTVGITSMVTENPILYIVIQICITMVAAIASAPVITSGIGGAFRLRASPDAPAAFATVVTLLHSVFMLFFPDAIASGKLYLYNAAAVLILLMNTIGKLGMISRIRLNFQVVHKPGEKECVISLPEEELSHLMRGMRRGTAVAAPVKVSFLSHFLDHSYREDPCARVGGATFPAVLIGGIAVGVSSYLMGQGLVESVSAFVAVCCLCVPLVSLVAGNWPLRRIAKRLTARGGVLTDYMAADDMLDTCAVAVDAGQLFGPGQVVLNGIKTFGDGRVDQAILDTAALVNALKGPLSPVFDQVIQDKKEILPKVESPVYEQEMGLSGWVDGRRVLVGNRELLRNHGIEPPSMDYERRYAKNRRKLVYLCSGGVLSAMFVVTYILSSETREELQNLVDNGMTLLVHANDPNISSEMLSEALEVEPKQVIVLQAAANLEYEEKVMDRPEQGCSIASDGAIEPLLSAISSSFKLKRSIQSSTIIQTVGVLISFILVAFLSLYSSLSMLTPIAVLLFQACWALAAMFPPFFRSW